MRRPIRPAWSTYPRRVTAALTVPVLLSLSVDKNALLPPVVVRYGHAKPPRSLMPSRWEARDRKRITHVLRAWIALATGRLGQAHLVGRRFFICLERNAYQREF